MTGISVSDLKTENFQKKKKRRFIPNFSSMSNDYSNPETKKRQNENQKEQQTSHTTDNKLTTNWQQTSHTTDNKLTTNWQQTDNKLATNWQQTSHTTDNKKTTNWQQTDNKLTTAVAFCELSGLQQILTKIVFYYCNENASDVTPPISISYLAEMAKSSIKSVKVTIQRLAKKGVISKHRFKNGRGGWTQYKIEKRIYSELLTSEQTGNKLTTNWQQTDNKLTTNWQQTSNKLATQLTTTSPSSNSLPNTKNTNTTNNQKHDQKREEEKEWGLIQTPEVLKKIGMGKLFIEQAKNKFQFSSKEFVGFLEAFAYDLENGELERLKQRKIQNLLGYFYGALRNGGYNSVTGNFKTSEEIGEEEAIAYLEQRKKGKEERKEKLTALLLEEWIESKTREEIIKLVPPMVYSPMGDLHMVLVKDYFIENEMGEFQRNLECDPKFKSSKDKTQEQLIAILKQKGAEKKEIVPPKVPYKPQNNNIDKLSGKLKDKNQERRHPPSEPSQNTKQKRQKNASDVSFRLDLDSKHLSN